MKETPNPLAEELQRVRKIKAMSRHAVAKPAKISAAYLQKLEQGAVKNPSPRILYRLAGVLGVSYARLMEVAGYAMPSEAEEGGARRPPSLLRQALLQEDLSEEEWRAVAAFVAHLKAQRQGW